MYMLTFSYKNSETTRGANGVQFKQGDTVSVRGTRAVGNSGWNTSLDGVYKVTEITSRGLVVTGGATATWGNGSVNMPMNGVTVSASGGASISNAKEYFLNSGILGERTTDWWLHAFTTRNTGGAAAPARISPPFNRRAPQPPRPVIDPGPPPRDNGNNLNTGTGPFNVGEFIARANFKLGTSAQANNRGAAQFIADATKAAKTARLTESQTKTLLDAVRKAIADARAKGRNKPLPKPKKRR